MRQTQVNPSFVWSDYIKRGRYNHIQYGQEFCGTFCGTLLLLVFPALSISGTEGRKTEGIFYE